MVQKIVIRYYVLRPVFLQGYRRFAENANLFLGYNFILPA